MTQHREFMLRLTELIEKFGLDDEIDWEVPLKELDKKIINNDSISGLEEILELSKQVLINDDYIQFRVELNKTVLANPYETVLKPFRDRVEKRIDSEKKAKIFWENFIELDFDVNAGMNAILSKYTQTKVDFLKHVKNKPANYIDHRWIDRTEGRHLCNLFVDIPYGENSGSDERIYEDIYAKDKNQLGYIRHFNNDDNDIFYLARGPIYRGDADSIFVIDDLGLSICKLPSITRSRSRATADDVPRLLDEGYYIFAAYRSDNSGHLDIFKSDKKGKQPKFIDLNQEDELLVYFGIGMLIYSKLVQNKENRILTSPYHQNEAEDVINILKKLFSEKLSLLKPNALVTQYEKMLDNFNKASQMTNESKAINLKNANFIEIEDYFEKLYS